MLLKSQIGSGVVRRSTNFIHDYQVDDKNAYRQDTTFYVHINVKDEINGKSRTDKTNDQECYRDRCQTNNHLLRSVCCTPHVCLYTFITDCLLCMLQ